MIHSCLPFLPVMISFAVCATTGGVSDALDIFNFETGAWSTAKLSVARGNGLAATSIGKVAIFAGGQSSSGTSCILR
jgi:hypothetical protein